MSLARSGLVLLLASAVPLFAGGPLAMDQHVAGSGLFNAYVSDAFDGINVNDDWVVEAEGGDRITVEVQAAIGNSQPRIRLLNAAGSTLVSVNGGSNGRAAFHNFEIPAPGTYRVRVFTAHEVGGYVLRVLLGRGLRLENEPNDTLAQADRLPALEGLGAFQFRAGGSLERTDPADVFNLGWLNAGAEVTAMMSPAGSAAPPAGIYTVELWADGAESPLASTTASTLAATVAETGRHHLRLVHTDSEGETLGAAATYFLEIEVEDSTPMQLLSSSLPAEGAETSAIITTIELNFSIDPGTAAANDLANFELRRAGSDGVFGTADDHIYTLGSPGFVSGETITLPVIDGPLQPGLHRFTAFTTLTDRAGNPLTPAFVRTFEVRRLDGIYQFEGPANESRETAGSLSFEPDGGFDGSFGEEQIHGIASNPMRVRLADVDGNGILDAVVAHTGSNDVRVYPGNGDGTFGDPVVHDTGSNPWSFVLGDFNGDGRPDLAVAAESTNQVEIWLNAGDGSFGGSPVQTLSVGSNPRDLAAADLTGNGLLDLVAANRSGHSYSVLLAREVADEDGIGTDFDDEAAGLAGWIATTPERGTTSPDIGNPRWEASGGNPGGFFAVQDLAQADVIYFAAPADYLGDRESSYGLNLRFDLQSTTTTGGTFVRDDIVMEGAGQRLVFRHASTPNHASWTTYEIRLEPGSQWRLASTDAAWSGHDWQSGGDQPTEAQFRAVLADLTALYIRGEFWSGVSSLGLDNVFLQTSSSGTGTSDGRFLAAQTVSLPGNWDPRAVALTDLNDDGIPDLILANRSADAVSVHFGQGDGTFGEPVLLNGVTNPETVAVGDLTSDGRPEIVTLPSSGSDMVIYATDGEGGFADAITVPLGSSTTNREVRVFDVDGDGFADVLIARGNNVQVAYHNGDFTFRRNALYGMGSTVRSVDLGDLDEDGRPDLVSVNSGNNRLSVRLGLGERALAEDPSHPGVFTAAMRGQLSDGDDVDYFSFTGRAGQRVVLGTETPFSGSSSGLNYRIERPDGGNLINTSAPSNGRTQATATLPVDGRYYVRVGTNWNYFGEYRIVLTLLPPEWQVESEGNDSVSAANTLNLSFEDGVQRGQVFGYIRTSGDRDVFALGNLSAGTEIRLQQARLAYSELDGVLEILDSSGSVVAAEAPGLSSLVYTVPEGGAFFASIRGAPHGLLSRYFLWAELEDLAPPEITGDTLPEEGTTTVQ
ncbi:MAG: hypothetical protein EA425_14760, partial [Puniceicoccaceae bacterium]